MADLTRALARFVTSTAHPDQSAHRVLQLSLLDWFAVGHTGRTEPVACLTRDMALADGGASVATIFGTDTRLPVRAAALVNGTTSHALDYDDTHFAHIGHPSVAIIPAGLAVAQAQGATGAALQRACLIGVEASVRIGVWLGRAHYQTGYHQTATAGTFGAALASAALLNQTADQVEHSLGLAATRAAGLKAQFGTMGKPFNAGIAAQSGVEAALLVSRGFVSNPDAMDGPHGFGATHHGQADMAALDGLGTDWMFETVSHKFHACCHGLHAALEAFATLKVNPDAITRIDVKTHPRWMTVCNQQTPLTGLEAKFSYRAVLALAALGYDTAKLDTYRDDLCADPKVQALRDKVHVEAADHLSETQAELTVEQAGATLHAQFDLDAPMPLDQREARIKAKAASLLGKDTAHNVWAAIETAQDADALWGCL